MKAEDEKEAQCTGKHCDNFKFYIQTIRKPFQGGSVLKGESSPFLILFCNDSILSVIERALKPRLPDPRREPALTYK